jgi:hypothetical protein
MSPFIVYGTVLPWRGSSWRDHPGVSGIAFREALSLQSEDWVRLQSEFPDDEFFVLGDFNQELVEPPYIGTQTNRHALEEALAKAGLVALTAGANDPVRRDLDAFACIDHICSRRASAWMVESTERWPRTASPERWLSDHFGVAVSMIAKTSPYAPIDSTCRLSVHGLQGAARASAERLGDLEVQLHALIRSRSGQLVEANGLALPALSEPLPSVSAPAWFPVPGMYGGFSYWAEGNTDCLALVCESWSRVEAGSGQRHLITATGSALMDEGFV